MFFNRKRLADRDEDQRQMAILYKKVFGTPEGRQVLQDMCNRYRVFATQPSMPTEYDRGRAEGKRDAILHILDVFIPDLSHLEKMQKGDFT